MMRNIIFVGMPGSGKTEVSKQVAQILDRAWFDCDKLIQEKTGMKISDIFETHGEEYFRNLETECLTELTKMQNIVVSSGGGAILKNSDLICRNSLVIYLKRDLCKIASVLKGNSRPLSKNFDELKKLYEERKELYEKVCDITLYNNLSINETAIDAVFKITSVERHEEKCEITKKAQKYLAVIGKPIRHSHSPAIHRIFAKDSEIDVVYLSFEVTEDSLLDFVQASKMIGMTGFNITMPLKELVIKHLDYVSDDVKLIGAVNSVVIIDGMLYGYNTDGVGFVLSLQKAGYYKNDGKVLILGTGGAAKAIGVALSLRGWEVKMASRHPDTLMRINESIDFVHWDDISKISSDSDLIVNATPLGMNGFDDDFSDLSFLDNAKSECVVYDLIYSPAQTSFLKYAMEKSLKTINGLPLLVYQAALAFKLFTGLLPCEESINNVFKYFDNMY